MTDFIPLAYLLVGLVFGALVYRAMLFDLDSIGGGADGADRIVSLLSAAGAILFWPLVALGMIFLAITKRTKFFRLPSDIRQEQLDRERDQAAEIAQLRAKVRDYEIKGGDLL